jgi:hypothetical protein
VSRENVEVVLRGTEVINRQDAEALVPSSALTSSGSLTDQLAVLM